MKMIASHPTRLIRNLRLVTHQLDLQCQGHRHFADIYRWSERNRWDEHPMQGYIDKIRVTIKLLTETVYSEQQIKKKYTEVTKSIALKYCPLMQQFSGNKITFTFISILNYYHIFQAI